MENIIKNTIAYDKTNKLIMKVKATAGLTSLDCSNFNIPETYSAPVTGSHPVAKIKGLDKTIIPDDLVYPMILPIGGSMLHIKCFTEKVHSGRAHKLKGFDLVEYAVGVFYLGTAGLPTKATDPRLVIEHSSRADFKLQTDTYTKNLTVLATGATEPAKIAIIFFRWAKSKHPTLDGPWSVGSTTQIMP
jgi:hypothetical protein